MTKTPRYSRSPEGMPSLTIVEKRALIARAISVLGEKAFLVWLAEYDITSIRQLNEHVRRYKSKFFRNLYLFISNR